MRLLLLALVAAVASAQSPIEGRDAARELAGKIADVAGPSAVLSFTIDPAWPADDEVGPFEEELGRELRARGLSVVDRSRATVLVDIRCGDNLRERACVAEIAKGGTREAVTVSRPHEIAAIRSRTPLPFLDIRQLWAQRSTMLDAVPFGSTLLVLEPSRVSRRPLHGQGASSDLQSDEKPITTSRVWPRDLRGRLAVTDQTFTAFLPGVTCRGKMEPLAVTCADEGETWPLALENGGIAAGGNLFTTPEGRGFFGAARLDQRAEASWLVADRRGVLVFLDEARTPVGEAVPADDVVNIIVPCRSGTFVLTASSQTAESHADSLSLFDVGHRRLVPAATPVALSGVVTALWDSPDHRVATAIVHDTASGIYEALQIGVSCAR
jgi:hypothetical protein